MHAYDGCSMAWRDQDSIHIQRAYSHALRRGPTVLLPGDVMSLHAISLEALILDRGVQPVAVECY